MDETTLKILVWPLAIVLIVVLLALIFRAPLAALISRITKISFPGTALDASEQSPATAIQQQKEIQNPTEAPKVPADHAMPPYDKAYTPAENEFKRELEAVKLPQDLERAWLIRGVIVHRFQRAHEKNYRILLGSQLSLLLGANTPTPLDMKAAEEIYNSAKMAFPTMYDGFSFDQWVDFPIRIGLARVDATRIVTTPTGRNFLKYLVDQGLTGPKPG
jgi:hypothetical protein